MDVRISEYKFNINKQIFVFIPFSFLKSLNMFYYTTAYILVLTQTVSVCG